MTALVDISVLNVNEWDPRFRYPQYEFFVPMDEMRHGGSVGRVEAADGDRGDRVTLELRGSFARYILFIYIAHLLFIRSHVLILYFTYLSYYIKLFCYGFDKYLKNNSHKKKELNMLRNI